jgi:hypothetical protein
MEYIMVTGEERAHDDETATVSTPRSTIMHRIAGSPAVAVVGRRA